MSKSAIIVPGFSEFTRSAEALAYELTKGPFALMSDVDIVPVTDALDNPLKYDKVFKDRFVVTHSAGILAVNAADQIMVLNGPEPTTLRKTLKASIAVNSDPNEGTEEGIVIGGMFEAAKELARHPIINARIPFTIRTFSTVLKLQGRPEAFPNGRMLFATDEDQYGFTSHGLIQYANERGIFARMLHGKHNHPMFQPRDTLRQVHDALSAR